MSNDFFGKPVTGEIHRYSEAAPQQEDPAILLDALNNVLEHPLAESVKWNQYTPYFNDGDACEFSIYSAAVKVKDVDEGGDWDNGFFGPWELGYYDATKNIEGRESLQEALREFESRLSSGAHYVILNEKFGDPAEVTATPDGFSVEYYEHD